MRKTAALKTILVLVNVAFIAFLASGIYSAIPPQYPLVPAIGINTTPYPPDRLLITVNYNVTNNGLYPVNNFYIGLSVAGPTPSDQVVNKTLTPPVSIQPKGSITNGALSLFLNLTYISAHPGDYILTLTIHEEFAYGILKLTINAGSTQHLPSP
nr:hypothetical protein [Candidatus Njordarchaeota archaeon]